MRLTRKIDHTQLLEMLAYRAECFPNYPIGGHIPEVFAALGRPIPIGDLLAQPPLLLQEPDALTIAYQSGFYDGKKAAQRPWVGLTPEDILALFDEHNLYGSKLVEFARAVETKIKEKNNG